MPCGKARSRRCCIRNHIFVVRPAAAHRARPSLSTCDRAVDTPNSPTGPQPGEFGRDYAVKFTGVARGLAKARWRSTVTWRPGVIPGEALDWHGHQGQKAPARRYRECFLAVLSPGSIADEPGLSGVGSAHLPGSRIDQRALPHKASGGRPGERLRAHSRSAQGEDASAPSLRSPALITMDLYFHVLPSALRENQ